MLNPFYYFLIVCSFSFFSLNRKYTETYQQNHILCDAKFRPSSSDKVVVGEEDDDIDELDKINQETPKSYFGQSNLF